MEENEKGTKLEGNYINKYQLAFSMLRWATKSIEKYQQ